MRKFLVPIVAAVSTLAIAVPASAQSWAPPVYRYQPYNFNYGFNGFNFARSMVNRVQRIRNDIRVMDQRRILSNREARSLDKQAARIQTRIYRATRYGIQAYEARSLEGQIRNLEYRISREATDWDRRYGRHGRRH